MPAAAAAAVGAAVGLGVVTVGRVALVLPLVPLGLMESVMTLVPVGLMAFLAALVPVAQVALVGEGLAAAPRRAQQAGQARRPLGVPTLSYGVAAGGF